MTIGFVQSKLGKVSAGTSATTAAITTTTGNAIDIGVSFYPSSATVTITDSGGHVWTNVIPKTAPFGVLALQTFKCESITGLGAHTFTATLDTSGYVDIAVTEIQGPAVLDQSTVAGLLTPDPRNSGNVTTTAAAELLIGYGTDDDIQPGSSSVSSPWTQSEEQDHDGSYVGIIAARQLVSSIAAYSFEYGFSNTGSKCTSGIHTWKSTAATAQSAYPIADVSTGSWQRKGPGTEAIRNLLTAPEDFSHAAWTTLAVNCTVNANTGTDPSGGAGADDLIEGSGNTQHFLEQLITSTTGLDYAFSVYAKPNGRDWIWVTVHGGGSAFFNVNTGVVGTVAAGSASIVSAANGFYRCSVVANSSGGGFVAVGVGAADNTFSYSGDGSSGAHLWGAQLEQASAPSAYQNPASPALEVSSANVYTALADGSTGTPNHLTFAFNPPDPNAEFEELLSSLGDPDTDTPFTFSIGLHAIDGTTKFTFGIYDGATLLESWTETVLVSEGDVLRTHTCDPLNIDNIINHQNLRIKGKAGLP